MKKEAEANAATDKAEKERIDKLNQADGQIFQTEKQLKEYGDKLSEGNKTAINAALESLKSAHQSQDLAGIDAALEGLTAAWAAASQEIYSANQGDPGAQTGGPGPEASADGAASQGDGVSDVDYEEVNEEDKK
jgi:molecular chaperone DnaK